MASMPEVERYLATIGKQQTQWKNAERTQFTFTLGLIQPVDHFPYCSITACRNDGGKSGFDSLGSQFGPVVPPFSHYYLERDSSRPQG